jgi:hypothetical protein
MKFKSPTLRIWLNILHLVDASRDYMPGTVMAGKGCHEQASANTRYALRQRYHPGQPGPLLPGATDTRSAFVRCTHDSSQSQRSEVLRVLNV